ncbi:MAG: hypothetical protein WCA64_07140 [Gallionella sp.]
MNEKNLAAVMLSIRPVGLRNDRYFFTPEFNSRLIFQLRCNHFRIPDEYIGAWMQGRKVFKAGKIESVHFASGKFGLLRPMAGVRLSSINQ